MKWENQNGSRKVQSGEVEMIVWKRNGGGVAAMIAGLHSAKMTLKKVNVPAKKASKALEVSVESSRLFC